MNSECNPHERSCLLTIKIESKTQISKLVEDELNAYKRVSFVMQVTVENYLIRITSKNAYLHVE